jgi:2-polyprenyl-3-methyl-5-hydroxy-6-metoxy-1,4-benzoquinol methylase
MNDQSDYWRDYFESRFATSGMDTIRRLDYSNEAVRQQTYACLLDGMGAAHNKDILDVGCGNGELARLCACLGGRVVGLDINRVAIERLARDYPDVIWLSVAVGDQQFVTERAERFDRVVCAEVLQYVDALASLSWLWRLLRPGGRLVLMVPNQRCSIIQRVEQRFEGRYRALTFEEWWQGLNALRPSAAWVRTLEFRRDQRLQPYEAHHWHEPANHEVPAEPPNRYQWVLEKPL